MKIVLLVLLTVSLTACAIVPLAPPPFYDGPGRGGPHGHFAPIPVPPPPPFGHHRFPDRHHRW